MKLRAVLSLQSAAKLNRIAAVAGLSPEAARNKTALVDLLCRHLTSPSSVASRLKALTADQRKAVILLAAEGGELLKADAVRELGDGLAHRFQGLLRSLAEAGLVFEDDHSLGPNSPLVGIPDPQLKSVPVPERHSGRLRSVMKTASIGLLRGFARELGALPRDARRPLVAESVRSHLLNIERLGAYVNGLSEHRRAIFDRLLKKGEVTRGEIRDSLGAEAVRELDEMLWRTPLFIVEGGRIGDDDPIRTATDLRRALKQLADARGGRLEARPEEALDHPQDAPSEVQDNTACLLPDLATLLGQVERWRPRVLKRGGMAKADLRKIGRLFRGESDPGYAEFLLLFAEATGMVRVQGRYWVLVEGAGERLQGDREIWKALMTFWQEAEGWNEWSVDRSSALGRRARAGDLKPIRREVLGGLRRCPKDRWISYPHFYRLLVRSSEAFRHLAENPDGGRGLSAGGATADELLRRMLRATIAWLGLIELGNPESFDLPLHKGGAASFRVTGLGRALLGGRATGRLEHVAPRTNPEAGLFVQPNLEVLAPPDLPYARFIQLCALADLKSIDVMACFQITKEAFQGAMNRGMSGEDIRRFLKAHSATGLPDIVEALIGECESKHGEIEIGHGAGYLTVAREALLEELYAQEEISACLGPRLSPVAAALDLSTRPEALFQALRRHGYMPRMAHGVEGTEDEHLPVAFRSSELSELVAFLEAALETLRVGGSDSAETVDQLVRRFRRGLRHVPDAQRLDALSRYRRAFERPFQRPSLDTGMRHLLHYRGENPATSQPGVRQLLGYAADHRLCVEIAYGEEAEPEKRLVEPVSEDHAMLFAYCRARKGDRVFKLEKIRHARLTAQRF